MFSDNREPMPRKSADGEILMKLIEMARTRMHYPRARPMRLSRPWLRRRLRYCKLLPVCRKSPQTLGRNRVSVTRQYVMIQLSVHRERLSQIDNSMARIPKGAEHTAHRCIPTILAQTATRHIGRIQLSGVSARIFWC